MPSELVEVRSAPEPDLVTVRVGPPETCENKSVRVLRGGQRPLLLVGDRVVDLSLGAGISAFELVWQGRQHVARASAPGAATARRGAAASGIVTAPMPGRVVEVHVRPGDEVQAGTPLIVIEAMKMQNALFSPGPGRVERVLASVGATIDRGAILLELILSAAGAP